MHVVDIRRLENTLSGILSDRYGYKIIARFKDGESDNDGSNTCNSSRRDDARQSESYSSYGNDTSVYGVARFGSVGE